MIRLVSLIVYVDTHYCYVKDGESWRERQKNGKQREKTGDTSLSTSHYKTCDVVGFLGNVYIIFLWMKIRVILKRSS